MLVELVKDDLVALGVLLQEIAPALLVAVEHLFGGQLLAVLELVAVVVSQRVVDAAADHHPGVLG